MFMMWIKIAQNNVFKHGPEILKLHSNKGFYPDSKLN